jgi:hypothetical protein
MKTFREFILDSYLKENKISQEYLNRPTKKFKLAIANQVNKHWDNLEKKEFYRDYLKRLMIRNKPPLPDTPGRMSARKDKHLYPSGRMSSHPNEDNPSTITKNPKKLRKQRALGEIS